MGRLGSLRIGVALYKEKLSIDQKEFKKKLIFEIVLAEWNAQHQTTAWIDRGDPFSAQKILDNSIKHLVNALYLLDRKFIPDEKWYYYFLNQLQCVDQGLIKEIKNL